MKEHWQETLTPHAFYLESEYLSEATWNAFHELAHRSDGELKFFSEERGWLDGLQIGGASSGRLVPVQISLDQLMILLSLQRQESVDGMTPSARALYQNPHTRKKLREYYSLLDEKL